MTSLIETVTDEMEVVDTTISDDPEGARRAGDRIARKYRAQGHACECIGVVAVEKEVGLEKETDYRIRSGFGMVSRGIRTVYIKTTVYCPVIFPKSIQEEE